MWSLLCIRITWLISTISVVSLHLATILRGEDVTGYSIHNIKFKTQYVHYVVSNSQRGNKRVFLVTY